jgi:anion-transporting  ArsA/GET3 family ATPase
VEFGKLALGRQRVYFVTGKGGTGKTSVCVAIARALARQGRRVLIVEVDAPRPMLPSYFGGQLGYEPTRLATRIEGCNVDFYNALRSYVEIVVPVRSLVRLILRNKVVKVFLTATPGARELVLLSRLLEFSHEPRWDHIVVDLPASGHALALFRTPFLARRVFAKGPLRRRAEEIVERFGDPDVCRVVFCALPGEMPVNETLETRAKILEIGLPAIGGVLLNHFPDEFLAEGDVELMEILQERVFGGRDAVASDVEVADVPPRVRSAVEAAGETRRLQAIAIESLERLREAFGVDTAILPVMPGTHSQVADSISFLLSEAVA